MPGIGIYNRLMITFDETKRAKNLEKHGIDLALCESIFDAPIGLAEWSGGGFGLDGAPCWSAFNFLSVW